MPTAPVWMTQQEMCDAFNVFGCDIRRAIRAIYKNMELSEEETMTKECMVFRRFIMDKIRSANRENSVHLFFSLSDTHPRCTC